MAGEFIAFDNFFGVFYAFDDFLYFWRFFTLLTVFYAFDAFFTLLTLFYTFQNITIGNIRSTVLLSSRFQVLAKTKNGLEKRDIGQERLTCHFTGNVKLGGRKVSGSAAMREWEKLSVRA